MNSRSDRPAFSGVKAETESLVCEKHGEYESKRLTLPGGKIINKPCPKCAEEKEAEKRKAEVVEAKKKKQRQLEYELKEAGIPSRFRKKKLEQFEPTDELSKKVYALATRYAATFPDRLKNGDSMLFSGNPGTGKTHLACGIANHVMVEHGATALYLTAYDLVRLVKESWRSGSEKSERQVVKGLLKPDLIVVDELGVQFGSNAENIILFDIMNKRYAEERPMIVMSNLVGKDLQNFLGDRILDRFCEGLSQMVSFPWESYRRKCIA